MTVEGVEAADDHLRRMVGAKPILGLAELVWNALDANAKMPSLAVTGRQPRSTTLASLVVASIDSSGWTSSARSPSPRAT